ncbi:TPA: DUF4440 domain-containing protein [Pseudomonas putida]|nr:DUF4440 domain-containing protein [Pseudomonas putida]
MKLLSYCLPATLLMVCLHAQANPVQHCQMLTEAQSRALFEEWNASLQTGDPAAVAKLYRNGAVLLPTVSKVPRLTPDERIDYFRHFLADRPSGKLDSLHLSPGCNTMTMAGLYTFNFAVNGKQVPARYTFTYRWDGQAWLISHHHSSLLPQG